MSNNDELPYMEAHPQSSREDLEGMRDIDSADDARGAELIYMGRRRAWVGS